MKTLFVIIGIVVIFGILISSGGVAGGICIKGVGCVRTEASGVKIDQTDGPVNIQAGQRP
jgi:hypothetical protein